MSATRGQPHRSRPEQVRRIAAILAAALVVLFALLNLDEVDVNWLVGTWQTPLIVVIAVSAGIGFGLGWIAARRRRP